MPTSAGGAFDVHIGSAFGLALLLVLVLVLLMVVMLSTGFGLDAGRHLRVMVDAAAQVPGAGHARRDVCDVEPLLVPDVTRGWRRGVRGFGAGGGSCRGRNRGDAAATVSIPGPFGASRRAAQDLLLCGVALTQLHFPSILSGE